MTEKDANKLRAVAKIIKDKFSNLSVGETIDLAAAILKAVTTEDAKP